MDQDYRVPRREPGSHRPSAQGDPSARSRRDNDAQRHPASGRQQDPGQRAQPSRQAASGGGARDSEPPRNRRKRTGGRLFSSPWVYLLFVFGVSAILAALCWMAANDVLSLNKPYQEVPISIQESDSYSSVVNQLEDKGLIEYKGLFRLFALVTGGKDKITPGSYWLNTDMDYMALVNALSARSDKRVEVEVTIPEGYSVDQIFKLLEEKNVSSVTKLQEMAGSHDYAFSFLADIPLGDYKRLEGYLFPDTYRFYAGENPRYILNKMLVNFDSKVTQDIRDIVGTTGYSLREILTIASMIEKETDGSDRYNIASVVYNRLKNQRAETAGFLQVDATIQYVLPAGKVVSQEDYQTVDSPYNTYKNKGLPPGPIANPGMDSILAAIYPNNTNYYFYALGGDGKHQFFRTYAEHLAFIGG